MSSESTRDQSQQPQGVDPNGVAAPGDSPSSRKSSTSSKGKASQAKLSTSSSGRDEVSSNGLRVGFKAALEDHVAGSEKVYHVHIISTDISALRYCAMSHVELVSF